MLIIIKNLFVRFSSRSVNCLIVKNGLNGDCKLFCVLEENLSKARLDMYDLITIHLVFPHYGLSIQGFKKFCIINKASIY